MNLTKNSLLMGTILLMMALYGLYFTRTIPKLKLDEQALQISANMTMQDVIVQQFDMAGHISHTLTTPLIQHIPLHDMHKITAPHIVIAQTNTPTWEINAKRAIATAGGQTITFQKQVVIHQAANQGTQESTLQTEKLTYLPQNNIAMTTHHVTFDQPGNHIQAIGMKAYLNERRVDLLSHAQGNYTNNHG